MKEDLITFETAKLAKEKGFDEYTMYHYDFGGSEFMDDLKNSEHERDEFSAPTQSFLQKWLRETHNIHIEINVCYDEKGHMEGYNFITFRSSVEKIDCALDLIASDWIIKTYMETLEAGLKEALNQIKL